MNNLDKQAYKYGLIAAAVAAVIPFIGQVQLATTALVA